MHNEQLSFNVGEEINKIGGVETDFKALKSDPKRLVGMNTGITGKFISDAEIENKKIHALRDKSRKEDKFYCMMTSKFEFLRKEVKLTYGELAYLWYLGRYVDYKKKDEYLKLYQSQKNKVGFKNSELAQEIGLDYSNSTWKRLKRKCTENNIIKIDDDGYFYLNSNFIFKGQFGGAFAVMNKIADTNNPFKNATAEQIGMIINLQRYLSFNGRLVENPEETDVNKLMYIKSVKQICEITGIDKKTWTKLWNTKVNGKCLVSQIRNANGKFFVLNPDYFSRIGFFDGRALLEKDGFKLDVFS